MYELSSVCRSVRRRPFIVCNGYIVAKLYVVGEFSTRIISSAS